MKKSITLILLCLAIPYLFSAQFSYTGGPVNSWGNSPAVWADAEGDLAFMAFNTGLYRTTDGENWEHLSNGIDFNADPRTIEVVNGVVLVGTNDGARNYRSYDNGDTFEVVNGLGPWLIPTASTSGPDCAMIGGTLHAPFLYNFDTGEYIGVDEEGGSGITHGVAFLGTDTIWKCHGGVGFGTTKYSHDNGNTWTAVVNEPIIGVGGGVMMTTVCRDFLKVGDRIIISSNLNNFPIIYTDDYGTTWQSSTLGGTSYSLYGKKFIKINDNFILTVTTGGIWKSTDQGVNWVMIQPIGAIKTMSLWKNDHLLVGTASGLFEFSNFGEGELVAQHAVKSTVSNLALDQDNKILAGNLNGLFRYDNNQWTPVANTGWDGFSDIPMVVGQVTVIGDSIYVTSISRYFVSGDNGQTFNVKYDDSFGYSARAMKKIDNRIFVGTNIAYIYYSDDNGASFTQASYTNAVGNNTAFGQNHITDFYDAGDYIVAELDAGYATSSDQGLNWTYYLPPLFSLKSKMAAKGNTIYYSAQSVVTQEKILKFSTDGGATMTDISLTGLPTQDENSFSGVWNAGGEIYTYNAYEAPIGLYQYNEGSSSWSLVENTEGIEWDGITHLNKFGGDFFANWILNGTWSTGDVVISIEENEESFGLNIYPNPSSGIITIERDHNSSAELVVFDMLGKIIIEQPLKSQNSSLNLSTLKQGVYILKVMENNRESTRKITIR